MAVPLLALLSVTLSPSVLGLVPVASLDADSESETEPAVEDEELDSGKYTLPFSLQFGCIYFQFCPSELSPYTKIKSITIMFRQ